MATYQEFTARVGDSTYTVRAESKGAARKQIAREYRRDCPASCGLYKSFNQCTFEWLRIEPIETEYTA